MMSLANAASYVRCMYNYYKFTVWLAYGIGTKHFTLGVYTGTGDKSDNVSNTSIGLRG